MNVVSQSGPEDVVRDVLEREQQRLAALRANDADVLENLLADDLSYVYSSGNLDGKSQIISAIRSGTLHYGDQVDVSELDIRAYPDIAVLRGLFHIHIKNPDSEFKGINRFTMIWVRDGESWKLSSWQSTGLPKN